jgi:hypothetical protein
LDAAAAAMPVYRRRLVRVLSLFSQELVHLPQLTAPMLLLLLGLVQKMALQ